MTESDKGGAIDRKYQMVLARLDRLSLWSNSNVWLLLLGSIAFIAITDSFALRHNLILGPLYVLPICLAGWRLPLTHALVFAVFTALVSLIFTFTLTGYANNIAAAANVTTRFIMYCVLAVIVSTFRYSFNREHVLANRDSVTGALNKRAFMRQADSMIEAANDAEQNLLLVFIDLDDFKLVNDRYGHEAGDNLLRSFGAGAAACVRRHDSFGRMGGDEFGLMLVLDSLEDGKVVGQILHNRLSAILASLGFPVSCSTGALIIPPNHQRPLKDLLRVADEIMYSVKRSGKNNLLVSDLTLHSFVPAISKNSTEPASELHHRSRNVCTTS